MRSVIALVLLLFVVSACSSPEVQPKEPAKKVEEYNTSEFDIWIGCKVKPLPDGRMTFEAMMGGNPMLFEVLLQAVEIMGQKLGIFPMPQSNDPMIQLLPLPYQDTGDDQIY